jgi:hypothetical protein
MSSITSRYALNWIRVNRFRYQFTPNVAMRSLADVRFAPRELRDGLPGCSADPKRSC